MARSTKKGPFIDSHLMLKMEAMNTAQREEGFKDLGAPVDDLSGVCGSHHRGA